MREKNLKIERKIRTNRPMSRSEGGMRRRMMEWAFIVFGTIDN